MTVVGVFDALEAADGASDGALLPPATDGRTEAVSDETADGAFAGAAAFTDVLLMMLSTSVAGMLGG